MGEQWWVPEHVRDYLRPRGFSLPLEDMEPWIREWDAWMGARGEFYDYDDTDGAGRRYRVHRRSLRPAMRVCREWGSLLLNEQVKVVCERQEASDWLASRLLSSDFWARAQSCVVRAFGLGTGALALWVDTAAGEVRVRSYDARMVVPLTWDEEVVTECALVTRVFWRGKAIDQLQMHLLEGGAYVIETACFVLDGALANLSHALLHMNRSFGEELADEGEVHVLFDDSIISDTAPEKAQDMAEEGVTMHAWEYRMKWYGEDEKMTEARARGLRVAEVNREQ